MRPFNMIIIIYIKYHYTRRHVWRNLTLLWKRCGGRRSAWSPGDLPSSINWPEKTFGTDRILFQYIRSRHAVSFTSVVPFSSPPTAHTNLGAILTDPGVGGGVHETRGSRPVNVCKSHSRDVLQSRAERGRDGANRFFPVLYTGAPYILHIHVTRNRRVMKTI